MDFNHTPTFLRSTILEDPFCLGDLLGPEDVLRIQSEYPDLFSNHDAAPSKTAETASVANRLTRLSQPKTACPRVHQIPAVPKKRDIRVPAPRMPSDPINKRTPSIVFQSHSAPNQSIPKVPVQVFKSPSVPTIPEIAKETTHSGRRNTKMFRSIPALSAKDDSVISRHQYHSPVRQTPRSASAHPSPRVPRVEERHGANKTGFLKPAPATVKKKPVDFHRKFLLEELAKVEKLKPARSLKNHDVTADLRQAAKKLESEIKKKEALAKLDRIIFQLPAPVENSSQHKNVASDDESSDDTSVSSPNSNGTETLPSELIKIRSQNVPSEVPAVDKEEQITKESMEKCEQLLLAKYLASKYEKEGKFKKSTEQPSPDPPVLKKRVRINSVPQNMDSKRDGVHKSRNVYNHRSILEREAATFIFAEFERIVRSECLKISREEKRSRNARSPRDVAIQTSVNGKQDSPSNSDSSATSNSKNGSQGSQSVPTPTLTPPSVSQHVPHVVQEIPEKQLDSDSDKAEDSLRTPTLTPKVVDHIAAPTKDTRPVDATDCSELEDFIASEADRPERLPRTVEEREQCITEISTPNLSTPGSLISEQRDLCCENNPARVEVAAKRTEVGLQVVPEEFNGNNNFDLSELESSLCSAVEIISEGELIRSEERSPGEISAVLNQISPGYQLLDNCYGNVMFSRTE